MIEFGDIRKILDKWSIDCLDCPLKGVSEDDIDNGIFPYESCNPDCSTYNVRKVKEEIMSLLDGVEVQ